MLGSEFGCSLAKRAQSAVYALESISLIVSQVTDARSVTRHVVDNELGVKFEATVPPATPNASWGVKVGIHDKAGMNDSCPKVTPPPPGAPLRHNRSRA